MSQENNQDTIAKMALINNEPQRLNTKELNNILITADQLKASDITLQTSSVVFSEIHGKLYPNTRRPLTNTEVGNILNYIKEI